MDEFLDVTPRPRRRLGLRLGRKANTTPGLRLQTKTFETATPLTESIPKASSSNTAETPRTLPPKVYSNSTICRRPGLTRKRNALTKKKLEFATNENSEVSSKSSKQQPVEKTQQCDWRQRQIIELERDLETWKNGFIAAVEDLQKMAEPRISKKTLLNQFGIPLEMLKYLDEEE